MKSLTLSLLFIAFISFSFSQEKLVWHENLQEAVKISKKENKPLMLFFTGSDWCGWCLRLQKEVFFKPEFTKWANENVVLVELDYPRKKAQPAHIKTQNAQLQSQFGVRGYPTIWFVQADINSSGQLNLSQLGKTGYVKGGPETWISGANQQIEDYNSEPQNVAIIEPQPQPPKPQQPKPQKPSTTEGVNKPMSEVNTYAVIVGIEDYEFYSEYRGDLRYTTDDTYKFINFLNSAAGGLVPEKNIIHLVDERATKKNIISALNNQFLKSKPKDRIIFYFSGHGAFGGLLPYDFSPSLDNLITKIHIESAFLKGSAKHKLLIADACMSGGLKGIKSTTSKKQSLSQALASSTGGYAVLQSSSAYKKSIESPSYQQGVFSYWLLKGLKGRADYNQDMIVTIQEVFKYLTIKVPNDALKKSGKKQNPELDGVFDKNMPMSILK